jgi:hypothetical protein
VIPVDFHGWYYSLSEELKIDYAPEPAIEDSDFEEEI